MSKEISAELNTSEAPASASEVPQVSSAELFQKNKVLRIEHQGQSYLLRITRENKLILTK